MSVWRADEFIIVSGRTLEGKSRVKWSELGKAGAAMILISENVKYPPYALPALLALLFWLVEK